jgi:hypothetical protein
MRFKVDENLHVEIAALLRDRGHDALTVFDQGHRGWSDRDIANGSKNRGKAKASFVCVLRKHMQKSYGSRACHENSR